MVIDKKTLDSLLTLPDDKLLGMLSLAAGSVGVSLPGRSPDPAVIAGLRALLTDVSDADIARAGELLGLYQSAAAKARNKK